MGVLQRFERKLEGFVEGAFARAFGGAVQPVEIATALQREAADKKAIVGHGRVLVPNDYVVELSPPDSERLSAYDGALRRELAGMVTEHAQEQGWSFVGPVQVTLEKVDEVQAGTFRVRSTVDAAAGGARRATGNTASGGMPRLDVHGGGGAAVQRFPLTAPVVVVGRAQDADLRLSDTGVSRRHLEIHLDAAGAPSVVDLGSTNGTTVNGRRVTVPTPLSDGDTVGLGATTLVFRQGG